MRKTRKWLKCKYPDCWQIIHQSCNKCLCSCVVSLWCSSVGCWLCRWMRAVVASLCSAVFVVLPWRHVYSFSGGRQLLRFYTHQCICQDYRRLYCYLCLGGEVSSGLQSCRGKYSSSMCRLLALRRKLLFIYVLSLAASHHSLLPVALLGARQVVREPSVLLS